MKAGEKGQAVFDLLDTDVFLGETESGEVSTVQLSYVKTALNIKWTMGALKNKLKHALIGILF